MVVYIFNFIDRQILVILQESIKAELGLSDKQLGLLSGFTFAVFYVVCGIPIARWADRYNRVNIVSLSIAVWSGMTALSGLTANFMQLLAARIGVGVGEAGGSPPSHSIISDYFPHEERGRALSVYSIGIYIGILIGFLLGGWVNQFFGWRVAFLVVGLPGILMAVVVKLTLREPPRGQMDDGDHTDAPESHLLVDLKRLWALRSFRYAAFGAGFNAFLGYGALNFMPSFAIRIYDVPVGLVGTWLALIAGFAGAAGAYAGGHLSDHLGKRDYRWSYWVPALSTLGAGLLLLPMMLSGQQYVMWGIYVLVALCQAMFLGPTIAMAHALVGPRYRALSSSVLFFVLNIIGLGLGPLTVGAVSDALAPSLGVNSIRWAIMSTAIAAFVGAGLYFNAARYVRSDLRSGER
ncbi:MAG: MFS transporter [Gammaproteobacteria bacterium]|nr:MFS transporter [Gammaproteobacteria bacterium]MBT8109387.1 MFS transporter [Gammaproteobacteria bacterium]NND46453.1 MFS transporter [Woeseiaceae bacterium]NNL44089.1 MFS transporter [Woeseiaceae bacterium]